MNRIKGESYGWTFCSLLALFRMKCCRLWPKRTLESAIKCMHWTKQRTKKWSQKKRMRAKVCCAETKIPKSQDTWTTKRNTKRKCVQLHWKCALAMASAKANIFTYMSAWTFSHLLFTHSHNMNNILAASYLAGIGVRLYDIIFFVSFDCSMPSSALMGEHVLPIQRPQFVRKIHTFMHVIFSNVESHIQRS